MSNTRKLSYPCAKRNRIGFVATATTVRAQGFISPLLGYDFGVLGFTLTNPKLNFGRGSVGVVLNF